MSPAGAPGDFDPPRWWGRRSEKNSLLSDIARRVFLIPASNAECERRKRHTGTATGQ